MAMQERYKLKTEFRKAILRRCERDVNGKLKPISDADRATFKAYRMAFDGTCDELNDEIAAIKREN